ncbi:MAG: hypothetical protein HYX87_06715 [Chloroflexi bacterium]|nr:hypothetical protein [Chloroflexota bacterium]
MLNRLEHNLLSEMVQSSEPFHALYSDITRDVPGTTLNKILEALVRLKDLSLIYCFYYGQDAGGTPGKEFSCQDMSLQDFAAHYAGRTHEQLSKYPLGVEYYFQATPKGRMEEAKEEYDAYYVKKRG